MKFYSQHGEDARLFEFFDGQQGGVCMEVGGYDGETFSNTLAFEEAGWRALVVEPMPHFEAKIRVRRPNATIFACAAGRRAGEAQLVVAHGIEVLSTVAAEPDHLERIRKSGGVMETITVPMRTLDDMLAEAQVQRLDFITIDVEGGELSVLAGFDLDRWQPRVVILENANGKRCGALQAAMQRCGYHYWINTGCNEWYLPASDKANVTPLRRLKNRLRRLGIVYRKVEESTGLKTLERTIRLKIKRRAQKKQKAV